jgi:hypothetical protein
MGTNLNHHPQLEWRVPVEDAPVDTKLKYSQLPLPGYVPTPLNYSLHSMYHGQPPPVSTQKYDYAVVNSFPQLNGYYLADSSSSAGLIMTGIDCDNKDRGCTEVRLPTI